MSESRLNVTESEVKGLAQAMSSAMAGATADLTMAVLQSSWLAERDQRIRALERSRLVAALHTEVGRTDPHDPASWDSLISRWVRATHPHPDHPEAEEQR